jgi:hypothetical protein
MDIKINDEFFKFSLGITFVYLIQHLDIEQHALTPPRFMGHWLNNVQLFYKMC